LSFLEEAGRKIANKFSSDPEKKKLAEKSDQSDYELELCSFVKNKCTEARQTSTRISSEGVWMTNTAYLLGYDSVFFDTQSRSFKPTSGKSLSKNRLHSNKILPLVQNRLARLCKNPPRYDVRPNSNDEDDKDAARLSKKVIENVWDREKINKKRINLMMWVQQCGHAWVKIGWDDNKGEFIQNSEGQKAKEGDISCDIYSALEVFPDPLAKSEEEMKYLTTAKVRKLNYFKERYPEKGHLVEEEDAWLGSTEYLLRINSMGTSGPGSTEVQSQMKNAAIEVAYYEDPSNKHPEGRMIIAANGVLLKDGPLPCGEIPFAKFDDIVVGGKFYSDSVITHLRPLQDQYNRIITYRADHANILLRGKYIAARGHGLTQEAINDQSGEVVEFDAIPGGVVPQAMSIPQLPSYAYQEEDKLQMMMDDISGINEVSKGQLPSASIPAIGMQLLTEQDDTRIGIITENHEYSWAKVGRLILKYAKKYYKTERTLKEIGASNEYLIKEFNGEDLGKSDDVIVVRGSTLPGSKVLKRQEIVNLFNQGLLGDPADPQVREKVLGMLEFGDVGEAWKDFAIDMKQIQRDIEMIEEGIEPPVHELDNHQMHVREKNRYRKGDKFYKLDEEKQTILNDNIEMHIEAATQILSEGDPDEASISRAAEKDNEMAQMEAEQNAYEIPLPPSEGIDSTVPSLEETEEQILTEGL
jgi:hypothetical protein